MKKNKMMIIVLMAVFCILLWGIFFMLGIKTIGAVLVPIALCLLCWGAGVVYERVIDRTGESKKVAVTMLLLVLLGILSVLFLSEGKDIAGKVVSFIFPSVLGGAIFAGGRVGAKCKEGFDEKKLASYKGGALGIGVASLLLYAFIVLNRHVVGTVNDVWQMIVFAVIFFIAGFYEKTSESKSEDSDEVAEESAEENGAETPIDNSEDASDESIAETTEVKEDSVEEITEANSDEAIKDIVEESVDNNETEDIDAVEAIENTTEEHIEESETSNVETPDETESADDIEAAGPEVLDPKDSETPIVEEIKPDEAIEIDQEIISTEDNEDPSSDEVINEEESTEDVENEAV